MPSDSSSSHRGPPQTPSDPRRVGRYLLYGPIARGGMATVHFARLVGGSGFSRTVAAKRLHEHFADDPEFIELFRNEARIASLIHHPNVVPVLDLVMDGREVVLVQEYVHGVPLDKLFRAMAKAGAPMPPRVASAILVGVLAGLHASHEAKDERGEPLGVIHRDVTPHNIVVGEDGVPRVLDFGIAKARTNSRETQQGLMKGKLMYMAPEQFRGEKATRLVDEYAAGVVLWELCTSRRLHAGRDEIEVVTSSVKRLPSILSAFDGARTAPELEHLVALDRIIQRMTDAIPANRFATAHEAMEALARAVPPASASDVSAWVCRIGAEHLEHCRELLAQNEDSWRSMPFTAPDASDASFPILKRTTTEPQSTAGYEIRSAKELLDAEEAAAPRPSKWRGRIVRMFAFAAIFAAGLEGVRVLRRELGPAPLPALAALPAATMTAPTPAALPSAAVAPLASASAPTPPASVASVAPSASAARQVGSATAAQPSATAPARTVAPRRRTAPAPKPTVTASEPASTTESGIPDFGGRL